MTTEEKISEKPKSKPELKPGRKSIYPVKKG